MQNWYRPTVGLSIYYKIVHKVQKYKVMQINEKLRIKSITRDS